MKKTKNKGENDNENKNQKPAYSFPVFQKVIW